MGRYRVFISYSHAADGMLAPCLQRALEGFGKPWYRPRAFHVFRDTTDLSATPDLWSTIERSLDDSDFMLYLASPRAAASKWVQKEQTFWRRKKDTAKILIALTAGEIVWDDVTSDFDWSITDAIPEQLRGAFRHEPLYLDFRNVRPEQLSLGDPMFLDAVATLAATLHGKSKDEMCGEHIRHRRRTMFTVRVVISTLLVLFTFAVVAAWYATTQRTEAERQRKEAVQKARVAIIQRLSAQANAVRNEFPQLLSVSKVTSHRVQ